MRQGGFELVLECDGELLDEHQVGDKLYAAADSGKTYKVKLNIYRNRNGLFPCERIRVGLYVDGYDVKNWQRISLPQDDGRGPGDRQMITVEFAGFFTGENGTKAFAFGPLGRKVDADADEKEPQFGSIRVLVFEAYISDIPHVRQEFQNTLQIPEIRCVEESRKFWQTASVTTVAGDTIPGTERKMNINPPRPNDPPQYKWRNSHKEPIVELTLHYHTSDMIRFLRGFLEQEEQQRQDHQQRMFDHQSGQQSGQQNGQSDGDGYQYYSLPPPQQYQEDDEVQFVERPPPRVGRSNIPGQVYQLY